MERLVTNVVSCLFALLICSCAGEPDLIERADRILYNGVVITVDAEERIVEAVAIRDGRLLAVGADNEVMVHRGEDTELVDLQGRAVLPGFIDCHGSFLGAALAGPMVNLEAPPLGPVASIADLQAALRARLAESELDEGSWLLGFGFDVVAWDESRYPTRSELDAVSEVHPVMVVSVSGEVAVANSLGLERIGIRRETRDPEGGHIGKDPATGELTGRLDGAAMSKAFERLRLPDLSDAIDLIDAAQRRYLAAGITTVQEDGLSRRGLRALIRAADDEVLAVDVVAYPRVSALDEMIPEGVRYGQYYRHFRFGGVQLKVDGPLLERRALMSAPYDNAPADVGPEYRGALQTPAPAIDRLVARAFDRDLQLLVVVDGDAATDKVLDAIEAARVERGPSDRRPILAGVLPLSEAQLARMAGLNLAASFPASHTTYWGDWLRDEALGADRASRISPAGSAKRQGLHVTLHDNAPEVPPDVLQLLASAVGRKTRSGATLGPDQRISVMDAIRAVTIDGAWTYFEEDSKGSIETGKRADLVVLSRNPLEVDPEELPAIEVVETLKDGVTVHRLPDPNEGDG